MILLGLVLQAATLVGVIVLGVMFARHTTAPERHYRKSLRKERRT